MAIGSYGSSVALVNFVENGVTKSLNTLAGEYCKTYQANTVYDLTLYKGYQHNDKTTNGVMIIKKSALQGFVSCQTAAINITQAYAPCSYTDNYNQALCAQEIQSSTNFVCGSFVQYNQSSYQQVSF